MMDLTEILSISGKPGLYKMLSHTKTGMLVESMADQKRFPVFAHEKISSLEEISIFTTGEDDLPLKEVFRKISDKLEGKPAPETFLKAAKKLGLPSDQCVVVEDAVQGVEAGKAAGMAVVAVTTTRDRSALSAADIIVDGLGELKANDFVKLLRSG